MTDFTATIVWREITLKAVWLKNEKKLSCSFFKSRSPQVFFKTCVVENFAKFTIKHLC